MNIFFFIRFGNDKNNVEVSKFFDQNTRRASAAVTDPGDALLSLLQTVTEMNDETSAGHADRVSQSDAAAVHIQLLGIETEDFPVRQGHGTERLVDFPHGDVVLVHLRQFQKLNEFRFAEDSGGRRLYFRNGQRRSDAEVNGIGFGVGKGDDTRQRLTTQPFSRLSSHQKTRRSAVVDLRGVRRGDRSVFLKNRSQLKRPTSLTL